MNALPLFPGLRRFTAEHAEHAENVWRFFSAVWAGSAVNGFFRGSEGLRHYRPPSAALAEFRFFGALGPCV